MTPRQSDSSDAPAAINRNGSSSVVLACEHATHFIPDRFKGLGLTDDARVSHAAWDPGAMAVACGMSDALDAPLVAATVSRLICDCNRPADAPDAMPSSVEVFRIPGNEHLDYDEKQRRVAAYHAPFHRQLAQTLATREQPILVTVHSFTPVYHGASRDVEIGILHDSDTRLADKMLQSAKDHTTLDVRRNAPYGPEDGVTYTLKEHAIPGGHLNVMLEIRNDLIQTSTQQETLATTIAKWLVDAFSLTHLKGSVACGA